MRHLPDGSYRFSPKDLIAYLEGDFAAWCERSLAEGSNAVGGAGRGLVPDGPDEETELVKRRGLEHEAAHLEVLRSREPGTVEIPRNDGAPDAIRAALRR